MFGRARVRSCFQRRTPRVCLFRRGDHIEPSPKKVLNFGRSFIL